MVSKIKLLGRVLLTGNIHLLTGLHIGGGAAGLNIGGVDNPVVRNPLDQMPYIPGSSLKGKMRSLAERHRGFDLNERDEVQKIKDIHIHVCRTPERYAKCNVCPVFGLPGEMKHATPTRLVVRDVFLDPSSLEGARTDFLHTEIKWETSIDRVTSAANPRPLERVPAGALFKGFQMIISLYDLGNSDDHEREPDHLKMVFLSMHLLHDDYLGGQGSRGGGRIEFINISVDFKKDYGIERYEDKTFDSLDDLLKVQDGILRWVRQRLQPMDPGHEQHESV